MKQKDFFVIGVIIFMSAIFSYFVSNAIFGSPKSHQQQAEVVQPISSSFPDITSKDYTDSLGKFLNKDAFDPTRNINISQNSNTDPFKATQ